MRRIGADACLPLRQAVLWPQAPRQALRLPEDDEGLHLGAFVDGILRCVASFFITAPAEARLRKFATDAAWQGRGLGSAVLREGARRLLDAGIDTLWFDARESATGFYQRFGFTTDSAPFLKGPVRYVRMRGVLRPLAGA